MSYIDESDAYVRYSDHKQDEGNSIEYQMDEIQKYCDSKNIKIRKWYIDKAVSAKKVAGRDKFYELIMDIKNGDSAKQLIVWRTNRLFRNSYESHKFRKIFREAGVILKSVTQNIDESTSSGRLATNILSDIDQYKSEEIAEHVIASQKIMVRNGFFIGGVVPLGYKTIPADFGGKPRKKYAINEDEAEIARKIFTDFANGKSSGHIIRWLNEEIGLKTRRGNEYDAMALRSMLVNDFYIGTRRYKPKNQDGIVIENAVPALIDKNTFLCVQDILKENRNNPSNKKRSNRIYGLTGKIYCAECGAIWHGKYCKKNCVYYTCSNKKRFKSCKSKNVHKIQLEKLVFQTIKENILNDEAIENITQNVLQELKRPTAKKSDKKELEKRRSVLMAEIAEIVQMKLSKQITEDVMIFMKLPKEKEMQDIERQIYELETITKNEVNYDKIKAVIKSLFDFEMTFEESNGEILKELFDRTVEKIVISDAQIDIHLRLYFTNGWRKDDFGSPKFDLRHQYRRSDLSRFSIYVNFE